jgi:peptidoglycan DL-endopeptidase CwlO
VRPSGIVYPEQASHGGRREPQPKGVKVRNWGRRLLAACGVSLALGLVTLSAGSSAAPGLPVAAPRPASLPGAAAPAKDAVTVADYTSARRLPPVAPLRRLHQADLFVIAPQSLPRRVIGQLRRLRGVVAAQPADAARIKLNGAFVAMLGVNPSGFRSFAAPPTARSSRLWQNIADGGVAVSYTMGKQDKLPLGRMVRVTGARDEKLRVGGFGTVGFAGVDAVVSDAVARSLGIPAANAIVVSAPHARLSALMTKIKKLLPRRAGVVPLVAQRGVAGTPAASGTAGAPVAGNQGRGLTRAEIVRFLRAAESRIGMPYVWGAAGPRAFDCSGLVQWSLRQAGVVMPRVAAYQALTGPRVPVSELQPGDLLFYHTDPTAPAYISHVAIYIGDGLMEQAPEPGMDVEVVPADTGAEFAGAVQIYPRVAAAVAAEEFG